MRPKNISLALKSIALTLCIAVISACSADNSPATPAAGNNSRPASTADGVVSDTSMPDNALEGPGISISGQGFFLGLLSNPEIAGSFDPQIQIPAIWVFSPHEQGYLTQMVLDDDALEKFPEEFSATPAETKSMTCQHVEDAAAKAAGKPLSLGCANGKWTALLLISASQCGESCPKYESALMQAGKNHPDALQVKTLNLEF